MLLRRLCIAGRATTLVQEKLLKRRASLSENTNSAPKHVRLTPEADVLRAATCQAAYVCREKLYRKSIELRISPETSAPCSIIRVISHINPICSAAC